MGLTRQSTGAGLSQGKGALDKTVPGDLIVALAGNPNTGKTTLFNSLTGLNQHTGNWPGKTVTGARGRYRYRGCGFTLVDLPGTYSLLANSPEEEVARDFICFGHPDAVVVVADATCLERNLNLALQVLEITGRVVLCVNLMDEAERKRISIDLPRLSECLGVPVVGTNARDSHGLEALKEAVLMVASGRSPFRPLVPRYSAPVERVVSLLEPSIRETLKGRINSRWVALRLLDQGPPFLEQMRRQLELEPPDLAALTARLEQSPLLAGSQQQSIWMDEIASSLVGAAEAIGRSVVSLEHREYQHFDRKLDRLLTSRLFGIPLMIALLGIVFWITIAGANYPSEALAAGFFWAEERLGAALLAAGAPAWLHGILVLGVFRTLGWVVSVMLPPMAIFFPMFTLLEDLGYLPRVAFNLDNFFKKACAHGKQALTMCMGFGCNAAGVISCRIIDSPRERLIAVLTNNFVPCNGRFPILISLALIFMVGGAGPLQTPAAAAAVLGAVVSGVLMTLAVSRCLSKTILKGLPSSFTLELPPYRKPLVGRILIRSLLDRTLFVLGRAVLVAAPAGAVIWLAANIDLGGASLLDRGAGILQPFAYLLGLDGYILMAFLLGLPANEIVIPIAIMSYMATGAMTEPATLEELRLLLVEHGWTWLTALCTMLFTLNHFPCATTLLTIYKETRSLKWTLTAFLVPTATGIVLCFTVAQAVRLLGLI